MSYAHRFLFLYSISLLLHRFVISLRLERNDTTCQRILFLFVADYETVDEVRKK